MEKEICAHWIPPGFVAGTLDYETFSLKSIIAVSRTAIPPKMLGYGGLPSKNLSVKQETTFLYTKNRRFFVYKKVEFPNVRIDNLLQEVCHNPLRGRN